jgi:hypothetical protein
MVAKRHKITKVCAQDNLSGKKSLGPLKCPSSWLKKLLSRKKNYVPQFLKQRDIISYYLALLIF